MISQEELEKRFQAVNALLEQHYPHNIQELADLTHESEEIVKRKIEYIATARKESKYMIIGTVLTYHRLKFD